MTCTTHHNACDCREAHFATIALEREHWFSLANQRALDLAAERERVRGLEAERAAMIEAINDAIRRPLGVVPQSAEQWYIPL